MIKFFRKIRQSLLTENKLSKYLLYAIGEIVLVVVGILLALQLNTWNAERIQKQEINSTYERMLEEIRETKLLANNKIRAIDSVVKSKNIRTLHLMNMQNKDSLAAIYNSIEGLTQVISVVFDMPTTSEFLNDKNVSLLKNIRLKTLLLRTKQNLKFAEVIENYSLTQLNTIIEPFVMKNLNYAKMTHGRDMVEINSPTDFSVFTNNLELENLINMKIETDNTKLDFLLNFDKILEATANEIESELNSG